MSRFFSDRYRELVPYTPGEQPREMNLIKLNTNENPYPPVEGVREAVADATARLRLYSDTECTALRKILAERTGLSPEQLIMTNGSDEALYFAFLAFCDAKHPAIFPDITYGFYPVFARISRVPFREIPLKTDWSVDPGDYAGCGGTLFLANPNAPTGVALSLREIEDILQSNPDNVVIVDEAYVDFGGESAIPLISRYENLMVVQTFSKSRSLAGLRLGFAAGSEALIRDMKTIQYSTNPYNVDSLAQAAGVACLRRDGENMARVREIRETRDRTREKLAGMGFETTESRANFLFVRHDAFPGSSLHDGLRKRNILIRRFDLARIRDWSRISIGTPEDMKTMIREISRMMEENA